MVRKFVLVLDAKLRKMLNERDGNGDPLHKGIIGMQKARKIHNEIMELAFIEWSYEFSEDLKDVDDFGDSLTGNRNHLRNCLFRASRMQTAVALSSTNTIRLTISLFNKGEKAYFYSIALILDLKDGAVINVERDKPKLS